MRRFLVVAGMTAALALTGATWAHADAPVTITKQGSIQIMPGTASFTITHGSEGGPNVLKFHVNLRPDTSPGGGPGTANTYFTVLATDPSPETFTVPLPDAIEGYCYVQADVSWTGGKATTRAPIPGACQSPSPSPSETTSSPTPTPTPSPSVTQPSPSTTSTVPTEAPSPSFSPPKKLAHTGLTSQVTVSLWIAGILLGLGLMILLAGRLISSRTRRH